MKTFAKSFASLVAAAACTACTNPIIEPVKPAQAPYVMQADTIVNPYINSVNDEQPTKPYHGKPRYQTVVSDQPTQVPAPATEPTPAPAVEPIPKPVPIHKLDVMPVEQPSNIN